MQIVLEKQGYTVLAAANRDEVMRHLDAHQGPIHLLLTDVVMPRGSGREIADELCRRRPSVKVLFLSGYTDDAVLRHGIVQHDVAFLQKPFSAKALAR